MLRQHDQSQDTKINKNNIKYRETQTLKQQGTINLQRRVITEDEQIKKAKQTTPMAKPKKKTSGKTKEQTKSHQTRLM